MFADSLLDSHWTNRSRRGWTTLASFVLQALAVGIVVSLPLLYTEGLPRLHLVSVGAPIGPPPGQRAPANQRFRYRPSAKRSASQYFLCTVGDPAEISRDPDPAPAAEAFVCPTCVPGGTATRRGSQLGHRFHRKQRSVAPPPSKPVAHPPRVSRMMEGNLVYKVQPAYPPMARSARIQGPVVLRAIISRAGAIENLQVLTGHPLLVKAAIDAVSQWRYRPYILNDEPVEVETQVTVNFILAGG